MPGFVKLDSAILTSSIWLDRDMRSVFITALLMAEPYELKGSAPEICVRSLEHTGWMVPPGWYGFVPAAGVGIVRMDGAEREEGMKALERLAAPDDDSRSDAFDGRRMVRVDGGYIILNYFKYRDRDHTAAERQRRLRERKKGQQPVTRDSNGVTRNDRDSVTLNGGVTANVTHSRRTEGQKDRVTTTTKTTTGASADAETKRKKKSQPWVIEGREWWEVHVGHITEGRFAGALVSSVQQHGWPKVFAALKCYAEDARQRGKTAKPDWCAAEIVRWVEWAAMPATDDNGNLTSRGKAILGMPHG